MKRWSGTNVASLFRQILNVPNHENFSSLRNQPQKMGPILCPNIKCPLSNIPSILDPDPDEMQ